jgi:hypothetical protein
MRIALESHLKISHSLNIYTLLRPRLSLIGIFILLMLLLAFETNCYQKTNIVKSNNCLIKVQFVKRNKDFSNLMFYYFCSSKPNDFKNVAKYYSKLDIKNEALYKSNFKYSRWKISYNKRYPDFFVIGFFLNDDNYSKSGMDSINIITNQLLSSSCIEIYSYNRSILKDTIRIKKCNEFKIVSHYSDIEFNVQDTNWIGVY